jgi:hypothetical protein
VIGPDELRARFEAEVARSDRRRAGAFWTPEAVADRLLDAARFDGKNRVRIVDPCCGGGSLLFAAARRMRACGRSAAETARALAGIDIDPRAAADARAALASLLEGHVPEIVCADVLAGQPVVAPGDLVLSNPPWIRFADVPRAERERTLPLWRRYGLFSLAGQAARLGGGDKDVALLFTLVAADHYLAPGGRLAVVITLEALKAKGAGEGFRRFQLPSGEPLAPVEAHDLVGLRAFPGAANKAAILVLDRGAPTRWPVPFFIHRPSGVTASSARPVGNREGAQWQVGEAPALRRVADGPPAYRARLGARVEPYGVFWLRILERDPAGGLVLVENVPELGKRPVRPLRTVLEAEFVRPALRGRDVRRGRAVPTLSALLLQDPARRRPIPEAELAVRGPRTLAYLEQFREVLATRGSRVVRELAARTAFYAQYGVGPYTLSPTMVVWNRMGRELRAAVSGSPVLPTDTCCLIACDSLEEAGYLAELLNSAAVAAALASASDPGRGFASPQTIDLLAIPRFDGGSALHQAIAGGDTAAAESLLAGAARSGGPASEDRIG